MGFDEIAKRVGYANRSGAWKAVMSLLEKRAAESAKDADAVISMELERLDAMLRALWPKVEKGDTAAIDRVIKIQDRRAKYLGLDAPTKTDITGTVEVDARESLVSRIAGLVERAAAADDSGEPDA